MTVKWPNVVALAFLVVALIVFVTASDEIGAFLGAIRNIGPGHSPDDQVMGLLAYGLVLAAFVAAVKIIVETNRKDKG